MTRTESTVIRRGTLRTLLVLLLALMLCCGILPGRAQAAYGSMTVEVEQPPNRTFAADTNTQIILGSDGIFKVTSAVGVRAVRVVVSRGSSSGVTMQADKASSWRTTTSSSGYYFSMGNWNGNLTSNEINTNLSLLLASFVKTASRESVTFEVTIKFSPYIGAMDTSDASYNDWYWSDKKTTQISFIPFATASTGLSNVSYSVDNKVDGTDQNLIVPISEGANANLSISLDNLGGASNIIYGFRYKESTSASWLSGKTVVDSKNSIDVVSTSKPPIKRTLETGAIFKAGVSYDVQGVIISNGQTAFPKYTNTVQVRYDKPVVNSFNVGATTGSIFKGGEDSKNLALMATFNNTNYDGMAAAKEVKIGGQYYSIQGPVLAVSAYFTDDYEIGTVTGADGVERQVDNSVWTAVPNDAAKPADVGKTMWLLTVPKSSRTVNLDWLVAKLPLVDSLTSAYKITVMDPYSGYTATTVSGQFTIDSNAPSVPNVTNRDDPERPLGPEEGEAAIVGGTDSKVTLHITGSQDAGSGLQAYQYSIYYISTADGDRLVAGAGDRSTQAILRTMKNYTYIENGNPVYNGVSATLTPWTTLKLENENDQIFSTVAVSKDGYYRVDARATDRAERNSAVKTTLFRVDLSVPNTPVARMATKIDGIYAAYDNNIYSNMETWALLQVPAMTGKTVDTIQYSTDGGLRWKDAWMGEMLSAQSAQVYNMVKADDGSYNGNTAKGKENFSYHVGIKLTGADSLGLTGYQSVLFRTIDTLGNNSLASNPVAVRTSEPVLGTASLQHEGVEVALSMGNSTMKTDELMADLKNGIAKKINAEYLGVSSPGYARIVNHNCTWNTGDYTGGCIQSNCPYKDSQGYTYFTPEMVNVQGITSADASNQKEFKWYRYDHTNNSATATVTVNSPGNSTTNLSGISNAYLANGKYTAAKSRVIYLGRSGDNPNGFNSDYYNGAGTLESSSTSGIYTGTVMGRYYHMSTWASGASGGDLTGEAAINEIRSTGYYSGSLKDWLFLYNDQSAKKTIGFTISDGNVYAHSNDGYGFWFNTTQRQNQAGKWVISGYMLYIGKPDRSDNITSYRWMILRLTDVPLEQFSDATLTNNGGIGAKQDEDLAGMLVGSAGVGYSGAGRIEVVAFHNSGLYTGNSTYGVRHFRLVTEGTESKLYAWQEKTSSDRGVASDFTAKEIDDRFKSDTNNGKNNGTGNYTTGFTVVNWQRNVNDATSLGSILSTPRPTVDGITIGAIENTIYKDTNCYGFGPIVCSKINGHTCTNDTQVIYSNISMSMNVVRKLSEVVTEPQWGEGKAKYIVNLSDDSVEDFNDAVLSAQIQWRLFNDNARYVGWGSTYNELQTLAFLKRIDGEGTFISTASGQGDTDQKYRYQVDRIADYIANIYYAEFGLDSSGEISGQVEHQVTGKVQVYNLEDVQNWRFAVTPKEYNSSTANADYPSGCWYFVHDTNGFGNSVSQISRSGQFSDALDLSITEAGRYMIYFAPRMEDVENGTLDPKTAVFNIVVNQTPRAQFTGALTVSGGTTTVGLSDNISYDPDTVGIAERPKGSDYNYTYYTYEGGNKVPHTTAYNAIQLNGVAKTEWRWSIIKTNDDNLTTLLSTNWSEDSPKAKTLAQLTSTAEPFGNFVASDGVEVVRPTQQFSMMPENSVMTVYLRVTDTTAELKAARDGTGKFTGYEYVSQAGKVSKVTQQNLTTSSGEVTYSPLSSFSLSTVSVYDTAMTTAGTVAPTVTRRSSNSQGRATEIQWALSVDGSYVNMKRVSHQASNPDTAATATILNLGDPGVPGANNAVNMNPGLTDCYIYLQGEPTQKKWKGISWNPEKTETLTGGMWYKVLSGVEVERWESSTASGMGTWEISKKFVDTFLPKGDKLVLQITERLWGTAIGDAAPSWVSDSSARTLYYKQDDIAPSAQTVTAKIMTKQADGSYTESAYAASNYLDVTDDDKYIKIEITGAKDAEGSLAGYGYYFYKKDAAGKIDPNSHEWYDPNKKEWVNVNNGYRAITTGVDGQPISNTNNTAVLELKRDMMKNGSTPQQSFHLAIWAYDNQTSMTTLTRANQSAATTVEDIKLSRSKPMPPEITVTNAVSQKIAHIGNDNGYSGMTDGNDKQTGAVNFASNTPVTVTFKPRQDKYSLNTGKNELEKNPNGTVYYEDIFKSADLTNSAMIRYSVEYQAPKSNVWTTIESADIPAVNIRTYTNDGTYKVHARVLNGVGRASEDRTVQFLIDKTPPAAPKVDFAGGYLPGTSGWAQKITFKINGGDGDGFSTQVNSSLWIFMDSDKGWERLGNLESTYDRTITATGNYTVRVKSVDQAGNETEAGPYILKVDSQGPSLPKPAAQADAQSTRIYLEQVIYTKVTPDATRGIIQHIDKNSGMALNDTAVTVNLNEGTKKFKITANPGYTLTELWVGPVKGQLTRVTLAPPDVTQAGSVWTYTMPIGTLTSDQSLQAVFKTQAEIDQGNSRLKSRSLFSPLQTEPGDAEAREGTSVAKVTLETAAESTGSCVIQLDGVSSFPVEVSIGATPTLSLTPSRGTRLNTLKVGSQTVAIENMSYQNGTYTYSLPPITGDVPITVKYTQMPLHTVTLSCERWGTIEATDGYASKNGNVYKVYQGDTLTVQLKSDEGYKVDSLLVGTSATGSTDTVQSIKITGDVTIKAVFSSSHNSNAIVTVNFNSDGGMVTPNGEDNPREPEPGKPAYGQVEVGMLASQTFVITPKYGYHIQEGVGGFSITWFDTSVTPKKTIVVTDIDELTEISNSDGTISYSYRIPKVVNNEIVKVTFAENRYEIGTFVDVGGKITTDYTGDLTQVRQDEKLNFTITPDEGYKLTALKVNGISVGAVTSYSLTAIQNYSLEAVFEPKSIKETVTTHSITVQANNVSDAQDRLADQPYSFKLGDAGTWTSYQESSKYTFSGLEPNRQYKVFARAKDAVGNVTETSLEIYTLANVPGIASVSAKNETDNSESKSVLVEILPNGNPIVNSAGNRYGTKYMVYYSERNSMEDAQSTGEWKLPSNGFIEVKNLEPGKRYFLQVAASNQDGVESGVDESSVGNILLTPTAPPANSMYVADQTEPGGGITIHWDTPQSDNVTHVVIYRDGAQIAMRSAKEENSFVDNNNIRSDAAYLYSYAYLNPAGLGSSRNAVSKAYYDAVKAAALGNAANKTALDKIITASTDTTAFYDTVTYPAFPAGMSVIFNSPVGDDESTGKLQVRVETNGSKTNRSGRYYLSLQAYGDNGHGVYDQKIEMSTLGANYAPRYTVVTDSRGAIATWEGLSSNYEYEVYLDKITNTGAAKRSGNTYTDGYGGSTTGVEGTLGRRLVVDEQGYSYEYDETVLQGFGITYSEYNKAGLLPSQTAPVAWPGDAEKLAYTGGRSWNAPLSGSTRIKFNKPPRASLPAVWYDESRLTVDGDDKYILVDKTMNAAAANFNIKINAWDPDGASESAPVTIYANIGGTLSMASGKPVFTGGVTNTKTLTTIATTEAAATAAPVELTFSGQQLSAGVYDKLTVVVTDGQLIEDVTPTGLRVVANQVYPSISITGGAGIRKVEQDKPWNTVGGVNSYTIETTLGPKTDEIARRDQMRPLRLQIMKAEYVARYGSYSEAGIIAAIRGNDTFHTYALSLLTKEEKEATGTVYYNPSTKKLTDNGIRLAIDKEPLNTVTYFSVTQESYNSVDLAGVAQERQRRYTEQVGGSIVYWVEQKYALDHGLCPWVKLEAGIPVVKGTLGETYDVRIIGSFGQNTYPLTNRFKVMQSPSVKLESARLAAWFEVDKFEYLSVAGENENANLTVEMINQMALNSGISSDDLEQTTNTGDWAYRTEMETIEGTETGRIRYFIYKIGDSQLSVGKDYFVGNVVVDTGVFDTLNRVGIFLTTNKDMNPNDYQDDLGTAGLVTWLGAEDAPPVSSGTYTYTYTGLRASNTYYVWTCYVTGKTDKPVYNQVCVMVTTSADVQSSIYTFSATNMSIREADYEIGASYELETDVVRLGDKTPQVKIGVSAEYFKADEYGHILNGNGEIWDGVTMSGAEGPQTITKEESKLSIDTGVLEFKGANVAGGVVDESTATKSAVVKLKLTPKLTTSSGREPHHTVMRLHLKLLLDDLSYTKGYNYLAPSGKTMDIFLLDQEAPVTTYKVGAVNPAEGQPGHMTVKNDIPELGRYYEYELSGQRVNYTSADTFEFAYENIGSGDLSNIIVEIYDESRKALSDDFFLTQQPIPGSLPYVEGGEKPTGTAAVMAVTGLEDGVHECWVRLRDGKTEEKDYVWIHLIQVVGQSALTGRIYATQEMPVNEKQYTGVSHVYLYPMDTTYDQSTGTFSKHWEYDALTNPWGGEYTIEHILNGQSYYVVVERNGFITYNSVGRQHFDIGGESVRMEFNLRMLAGDVTGVTIDDATLAEEQAPGAGDGIVNQLDEAILTRCYNLTYKLGGTEPPKTMLEYLVRRCDFNLDGAVNGLDRAALYNNMFKTMDRDYKYAETQPVVK